MGLRALVLGGTGIAVAKAAKVGLLAKFLLIFKKGFIVIFIAIGGFIKWLTGRKKEEEAPPPPTDDDPYAPTP